MIRVTVLRHTEAATTAKEQRFNGWSLGSNGSHAPDWQQRVTPVLAPGPNQSQTATVPHKRELNNRPMVALRMCG
jgi:hypothetical protein